MKPTSTQEQARLEALRALGVLDTPPEPRFDKFTALAAAAFSVPVALVSLIDAERQWFKSRHGLALAQTARPIAFCALAVDADAALVVGDTLADPRFADNPLVSGAPHIRFYAGHPIRSHDGYAAGTLCIIDTVARTFSAADQAMLAALAQMVEQELNRDALVAARAQAETALHTLNLELEQRVRDRTNALEARNAELRAEIARRAQVEATLRLSEERVRSMIGTSFSAFIGADAGGHIIEWNQSAERVFGWRRDQALGRSMSQLLLPARCGPASGAGMACFTEASALLNKSVVLQLRTRDAGEIDVEMSMSSYTVDGQRYFAAFMNDISQRQAAAKLLEQKQELLDAVLETVDVGVIACDAQGVLTLFNRAAREAHGQQAAGIDKREWAEHYDLYEADGTTRMQPQDIPLLRALAGQAVKDTRMVIAPRGLPRRILLASGRRLVGASGDKLGAVIAMKDITESSQWQDRLHESEQMLRSITEHLPSLIGQVDRDGRFVFLNSRALKYYGKPAHALLGQPVRIAYSDDDYARLAPQLDAAAAGRRTSFESEVIVDGKVYYHHAAFVPHFTPAGEPDGYFAMAFDITARRQIELQQLRSEERLKTITDNLPALISYVDCDLRYHFANAMYARWLGVTGPEMLGRTMQEVFGERYVEERRASLTHAFAGETSQVELDAVYGGRTRVLSTTYIPHTQHGKVVGVYVLATDATAARAHERQLLQLANSDPLTGLPNRRMYEFQLEKSLAAARRQQQPLTLMYLDLDDFKRINDTLGHAIGDEVLLEFGNRVRSVLRESDMLARLAGDEFTVILPPGGGADGGARVAAKILDVLAAPFLRHGHRIMMTASIGIAVGDEHATAATLAGSADAALYMAKRAGKNRFALLPPAGAAAA